MRLVKLCMKKTDKTNCIIRHGTLVHTVVMAMGLLNRLALWLVCVFGGFGSNGFVTNDAAIPNGWSL